MSIVSQNPATGEVLQEYAEFTSAELEAKLALADQAFASWRKTAFAARAEPMLALARILREKKSYFGELITREIGRPIGKSSFEPEKCALACEYYAKAAGKFLADEQRGSDSLVKFQPLGAILAVMPWNFPFWQVLRFAAPAIMAGNVGLLKHASNVPQCALAIEEAFRSAGFPEGVFQTLLIGSHMIEPLIRDPRVKAVTLTGSEMAGSAAAAASGREIKKTVMELGGSDPFIVLADADLDEAARAGCEARLQNAGQSCIAAKRFIVEVSVLDLFLEKFRAEFAKQVTGDTMDEKTTMGPLATKSIFEGVAKQVEDSVRMGAEVVIGGKKIPGPGYFYEPTILRSVKKGMPVYDEEVFGPAAAVIAVQDMEEAIAVANDSIYGLGASVWTKDEDKAARFIDELEAGLVFVNQMVKSAPELPFGGVKRSGYGRELSDYGIKEFVNIKTVRIL